MKTEDLDAKVGKRVTVRVTKHLAVLFPQKETVTGKLVKLLRRERFAPRALVNFGAKGKHEVRTADVLR